MIGESDVSVAWPNSTHLETVLERRHVAQNRLVETTGTKQSRVDQIGPAGGGQHVDTVQTLGTVHLSEHLVHHAIGDTRAVVTTGLVNNEAYLTRQDIPFGRNRVKLVKEQHTWLGRGRTIEEVTNRLLRGTNVLVQNLGTLDTDKVEASFLRNGGRQQRLSTTGVSIQKQTAGQ